MTTFAEVKRVAPPARRSSDPDRSSSDAGRRQAATTLWTRLALSPAGGAAEREADAAAPALDGAVRALAAGPHPAAGPIRLPDATRAPLESALGADLAHVRIHADDTAADAARSVDARAFTAGPDIVFGAGEWAPETTAGRALIGHELVHAAQQSRGTPVLQRQQAEQETKPAEEKPKGTVTMKFDGRDLIVFDGGDEVFRYSAQSGRPVPLDRDHADAVGADRVTDTYMNDPRFQWVKEFGPIPEGTYTFRPRGIETEGDWHGDWGSGRVRLSPNAKQVRSPKGESITRDGFFLHGGILAGSSGCIDIGNPGFDRVARWLQGYGKAVPITVKYEHPPEHVGFFTGFSGMLAYGPRFPKLFGGTVGLGFERAGETTSFLLSTTAGANVQWVGGGLFTGVRLDGSIDDRNTFIRLGIESQVDFRIYEGLFGELGGGYMWSFDSAVSQGPMVGTGIKYDFGTFELGVMYDHLFNVASPESGQPAPPAHVDQLLLRLGIYTP